MDTLIALFLLLTGLALAAALIDDAQAAATASMAIAQMVAIFDGLAPAIALT
jgi:hypothetical protein